MDHTDGVPGLGAPSDGSDRSHTHQRIIPVAIVRVPNLGPSMLTPRTTQSPDSHISETAANGGSAHHTSLEHATGNRSFTPSGDGKRRKLKNAPTEQDTLRAADGSLFMRRYEASTMPDDGVSQLRRDSPADTSTSPPALMWPLAKAQAQHRSELGKTSPTPSSIKTRKGWTKKYNDSVEIKASSHPVNRPEYPVICKQLREIQEFLINAAENIRTDTGGLNDAEVSTILNKCAQYKDVDSRCILPIILYGPAGSGKSTVLRCLLNNAKAAATDGGDKSCTNVKHEYISPSPEDSHPDGQYRADVHFFSEDVLRQVTKDKVSEIVKNKEYYDDSEDEGDNLELSKDLKAETSGKPKTDLKFLGDWIFGKDPKSKIESREDLERVLFDEDIKTEAKSKLVFKRVCASLILYGADTRLRTFYAKSLSQLHNDVSMFPGPVEGGDDGPWKLVDRISVYMEALVLRNWVRLVDVPGTSDTDETRTNAACNAVNNSSASLLVHSYDRISHSALLKDLLKKSLRNEYVSLVVTKMEIFIATSQKGKRLLLLKVFEAEDALQSLKYEVGKL
jgi:hypothetical protein